jgi:signal transduction histidine kinase
MNIHASNGFAVGAVAAGSAWLVTICVAGLALWRLRDYRLAAVRNAARWQAEQGEREQRAVLLERVHIARELHDVVAHNLSVIAVQAGLARYVLSSDPATAERALRAVAEMSSEGLAEVRRLVTVLRPDLGASYGEDHQDTPGIDQLAILIERVGLTGVAVEFTVTGEVEPLPAGLGLCLYRVVQEAMTNAIKHARGARVTVLLHYGVNQVMIRITNDGRGSVRHTPPPRGPDGQRGGGKGLTGMYERAMLYGGTLTAGGLARGGFEVVLTLPVRTVPPISHRDLERGDFAT